MIVRDLESSHRAEWEVLARAYKEFYQVAVSDAEVEIAWNRILARDGIRGLGAFNEDGKLVGITHFLLHTSTWTPLVCYLQDLFTSPEWRGKGVGRLLIEAVAARSKEAGATRLYWLTQESNATARALYDKVANFSGFIRYEYAL